MKFLPRLNIFQPRRIQWAEDEKNDHVILLHKLAKDHLTDGVTFSFAKEYLRDNKIDVDDSYVSAAIDKTFGDIFINNYEFTRGFSKDNRTKYHMTNEAYYRLLQHENYRESKITSRKSESFAIIAIFIAALSGVLQSFATGGEVYGWRSTAEDAAVSRVADELQIKEYMKNNPGEQYEPRFNFK